MEEFSGQEISPEHSYYFYHLIVCFVTGTELQRQAFLIQILSDSQKPQKSDSSQQTGLSGSAMKNKAVGI